MTRRLPRNRSRASVRRKLVRKYGARCAQCKEEPGADSLTIDHIYPLSKGGCVCLGNLQLLCETCNKLKDDAIPPPWDMGRGHHRDSHKPTTYSRNQRSKRSRGQR